MKLTVSIPETKQRSCSKLIDDFGAILVVVPVCLCRFGHGQKQRRALVVL